jgi:D-alanyl-lipoteichoic acid acyltransferase DltB (MBOAT superfamily)
MLQVDLYSSRFWWFTGLALIVTLLVNGPLARRTSFAALNLGFIFLHCMAETTRAMTLLLAAILVVWLSFQWMAQSSWARPVLVVAGGVLLLALFAIHKVHRPAPGWGAARIEPLLTLIGFSYVFLRLIELGRAVGEGRHGPPDLASMINYLLPFHMLAAGPIQSYDEFAEQPASPAPLTVGRSLAAAERIVSGLFKKYVLAGMIEAFFLTGFQAKGPYFFLEMQLNYVWLYLDFSAYSDVAVGLGTLMGVATPENFDRPLLSRNVIDFWQRWHITLSMFIRRNVFTPLQLWLMRASGGRRPLLIVSGVFLASFVLCGLWHGITWPWLFWGAYQASGLIACNLYREVLLRRLRRKGLKDYMAVGWIRMAATVITFEFAASAVLLVTYPWEELLPWIASLCPPSSMIMSRRENSG